MGQETGSRRWLSSGTEPDLSGLVDGLALKLEEGGAKRRQLRLYDAFNRVLSEHGLALLASGARFSLVSASDLSSDAIEADETIRHQRPVQATDFEPGPLRTALSRLLRLRAAVPLASFELQEREQRFRNVDGKIILRLSVRSVEVGGQLVRRLFHATPLRGYEEESEALLGRLEDFRQASEQPLLTSICELAKVPPAPAGVSASLCKDAGGALLPVVQEMSQGMLQVARQSESGICEDIDTEYLHDYRVAIRKLRSLISLVKGAYATEDRREYKTRLGAVARGTNRLRDLDVYLLAEADFRAMLPACLQPGLDRLFADFRRDRSRAMGLVRKRLKSATYVQEMEALQASFAREERTPGKRSEEPVGRVVGSELRRHYKLVVRLGQAIDAHSADDDVHALRIECKKLRYLLELFSPLFDAREHRFFTRKLRRLQNVLGAFNDCSVQIESLHAYLGRARKLERIEAAAVGALIGVLHDQMQVARSRVVEKFQQIGERSMKARLFALCASVEKVSA